MASELEPDEKSENFGLPVVTKSTMSHEVRVKGHHKCTLTLTIPKMDILIFCQMLFGFLSPSGVKMVRKRTCQALLMSMVYSNREIL